MASTYGELFAEKDKKRQEAGTTQQAPAAPAAARPAPTQPNYGFLTGTVGQAIQQQAGPAPGTVQGAPRPSAYNPTSGSSLGTYQYDVAPKTAAYSSLKGGGVGNTEYQDWATKAGVGPTWANRGTLAGGMVAPQVEQMYASVTSRPGFDILAEEMARRQGITVESAKTALITGQSKGAVRDPSVAPDLYALDPVATMTTARKLASATGVNPTSINDVEAARKFISGQMTDLSTQMKQDFPTIYGNRDALERSRAEAYAIQAGQGIATSFPGAWIDKSGRATDEGTAATLGAFLNYNPDVSYYAPSDQLTGAFAGAQQGIAQLSGLLQERGLQAADQGGQMIGGGLDYLRNQLAASNANNTSTIDNLMQRSLTGTGQLGTLARQQADAAGAQTLAGILGGSGGYNPAAAAASANMGSEAYRNIMNTVGAQALGEQEQLLRARLAANEQASQGAANYAGMSNQGAGQLGALQGALANPLVSLAGQNAGLVGQGMGYNLQSSMQDFNAQKIIADMIQAKLQENQNMVLASQNKSDRVQRQAGLVGQLLATPMAPVGAAAGAAGAIFGGGGGGK